MAKETKVQNYDAMSDTEKEKALETAIAQIEKNFGKGAIMLMNESRVEPVEAISTGCIALDLALGIGGVPRGRIVEIYGPESSGKTTLALHIIAEAQKTNGTVAFIDAEHALDAVADGRHRDAVLGHVQVDGVADVLQKVGTVLLQKVGDVLVADGVQIA